MSGRANALLPPLFFAPAALWFLAALGAAPLLVSGLLVHFYRARILALTHMITLGWLSMAMMGVLYRYLPALVKRPLPFPRLALLQWATFVVGVLAFVVHLWLGRWSGAAWAGGLLVGSAVLLCANIWPLLRTAPRHGVAEVGVFAASAFLVVAATIGTLLAIGKSPPILPGGTLDNLAGHAHLAGAGWVGITVCALSYRFLPAFLLPEFDPVVVARRLVVLLVAAVAALAWTLFTRSGAATALAIGLAAGVLGHAALVTRVVVSHRLPLDWTTWQAVASTAWCAFAAAGGAATAVVGVDDALGARLAAAYAIAGLLGWFSNLLIGVSYKLFPAFVMAARTELGRAQVPLAALAERSRGGAAGGPRPVQRGPRDPGRRPPRRPPGGPGHGRGAARARRGALRRLHAPHARLRRARAPRRAIRWRSCRDLPDRSPGAAAPEPRMAPCREHFLRYLCFITGRGLRPPRR